MTDLIVLLCLVLGASSYAESSKEPFALDDYLNGTFVNRVWNGTWISDDSIIYKHNGSYYKYNAATSESNIFLDDSALKRYKNPSITVSSDENFVLIKHNVKSVFRHSTTAQYAVLDMQKNLTTPLEKDLHIQYCQFIPGNNIIYVFENNIYHYIIKSNTTAKITKDGKPGVIYNGIPDWVYEEEVLGTGEALWVSPNGNRLVYAQFNDEAVEGFSYPIYGNPGTMESQYPKVVTIKYPKVGSKNPKFTVNFVKLDDQKLEIKTLKLPHGDQDAENFVLYGVAWGSPDKFKVLVMNRIQNESELSSCAADTTCTSEIMDDEIDGWLSLQLPKFNQDMSKMVQIRSSENFPHLHLMDNGYFKQISKGNKTVTTIYGFIDDNVYYGGSVEGKYAQQQVYYANLKDGTEHCLTCNFTSPEGPCRFATASFSTKMTYVALTCGGPSPNYVVIKKTASFATDAGKIWSANEELRKKLENKLQPVVMDLTIKQKGYDIAVRLLLPPNLDKSEKHPMLVHVYGGPNSNQITEAFAVGWQNYVVTSKRFIYAYIDGRGSGRRGDSLMHEVYKKLGTVEIEDQIIATKYLQDNYKYIDANRTGIWGWSYGGFATAWALVQDTEGVFKCGLSVAPVTSFIYYDSIYTERYMDLPEDNEEGYNNTDVTRHAEKFRGKHFFLIHGNGDDNVHYQQSMMLARALELADVPFRQMSYPDENHSLRGVSPHLYHAMDSFWTEHLEEPATHGGADRISTSIYVTLITISVYLFM